ncbi:uncharacterized protein LAESUDRAFT_761846 [Laetiporus sulphureus 93-53]|uniref:GDS1 winged helix domain-containing protein n=1 Tax=Laetiporus sulphureus 93-53 TaxID=1314785 RepID=A0A165CVB8_9APHY|nr:uncharacterized protein LAESUDRAFT_761846 [Laetiporus sulphureus 93-53]KZT03495.1 hypothetical protein LAESUDRAFT_761846 [Laetiporus sulphureus 93-53]
MGAAAIKETNQDVWHGYRQGLAASVQLSQSACSSLCLPFSPTANSPPLPPSPLLSPSCALLPEPPISSVLASLAGRPLLDCSIPTINDLHHMVSPVAVSGSQSQPAVQHQYGTRIRSNSVLKPSARLRQSADTPVVHRRIKPVPTLKAKAGPVTEDAPRDDLPPFPPPHVMLHSEDANNKVLLAIGRSFISVDNCAMTVKDLAELTMKYGLMCQNVSAAGQAITTYIRSHLQRCEVEQDQPLLLRHVMSGTQFDDDLGPALYSRVGGAHCAISASDKRITNFRRGTMVWYLSKAAGAPCPFARVGIRLCDYTESGKVGSVLNTSREKKRERDRLRRAVQCGQKRKRLVRACADKGSDSDSSSEEEKRPPKVKLTLRLRPAMAVSSSVVYAPSSPIQSTQTPEITDLFKHKEEFDGSSDAASDADSDTDSESASESEVSSSLEEEEEQGELSLDVSTSGSPLRQSVQQSSPQPHLQHSSFRRSPSVPYSVTSISSPPDSELEDDDFHISMARRRGRFGLGLNSSDEEEDEDDMSLDDSFFDFDADTDTQWESPGPRSPSAQFEDEDVVVKQESNDVGGILEAWDHLDTTAADRKAVAITSGKLSAEVMRPKMESLDSWLYECFGSMSTDDLVYGNGESDLSRIKQEDIEAAVPFFDGLLPDCTSPAHHASPRSSSPVPTTPFSEDFLAQRHNSDMQWRDAELLGPDSVEPHDLDAGEWSEGWRTNEHAAEAATAGARAVVNANRESNGTSPQSTRVGPLLPPLNLAPSDSQIKHGAPVFDVTSPTLLSSLTSLSIHTPTSPEALRKDPFGPPDAKAPLQERRLPDLLSDDMSVVHTCQPCEPAISARQLEGVIVYQMTLGSSLILRRADTDFVKVDCIARQLGITLPYSESAIIISKGSSDVCGTWAPLSVTQEMCRDHSDLHVFLSDRLSEWFPPLQHNHLRTTTLLDRWRGSFGHDFESTSQATRRSQSVQPLGFSHQESVAPWNSDAPWDFFAAISLMLPPVPATSSDEVIAVADTPLSPTEEEMFRVLCSDSEWQTPPPEAPILDVQEDDAKEIVENADGAVENPPENPKEKDTARLQRPLRRSKRVADAIANRTRRRSSKRGSRSSLS